jgi:hypothetical protein
MLFEGGPSTTDQNVGGVLALTITASSSPTLRNRCGRLLSK